jgi:large subunit ribosomal protein L27
MAHKKAAGSAKNLRDSNAKYRGVKLFWWQSARAGNIIIRQKGDKYEVWANTYKGKDATIHAKVDGVVTFRTKNFVRFDWRVYKKTVVEIDTTSVAA